MGWNLKETDAEEYKNVTEKSLLCPTGKKDAYLKCWTVREATKKL